MTTVMVNVTIPPTTGAVLSTVLVIVTVASSGVTVVEAVLLSGTTSGGPVLVAVAVFVTGVVVVTVAVTMSVAVSPGNRSPTVHTPVVSSYVPTEGVAETNANPPGSGSAAAHAERGVRTAVRHADAEGDVAPDRRSSNVDDLAHRHVGARNDERRRRFVVRQVGIGQVGREHDRAVDNRLRRRDQDLHRDGRRRAGCEVAERPDAALGIERAFDATTDVNVAGVRFVSSSWMFVLSSGPLFVTTTVYVAVLPMAATVGETDFVTLKSDSANASMDRAGRVVLVVRVCFVDGRAATALVYVPAPPFARTAVSVRVGVAPTAMVPTSQKPITLSNVPWLGVAETKSSPAGSTSVKRTPVARGWARSSRR